jgi:hypothetical protein
VLYALSTVYQRGITETREGPDVMRRPDPLRMKTRDAVYVVIMALNPFV